MKVYEEYVIPAQTSRRCVSRTCDLCGKVGKGGEWDAAVYEFNETEITVTIKQKEGSRYPEGGTGTEIEIDLCPDCFKAKLVPALQALGAKIEIKDWDF